MDIDELTRRREERRKRREQERLAAQASMADEEDALEAARRERRERRRRERELEEKAGSRELEVAPRSRRSRDVLGSKDSSLDTESSVSSRKSLGPGENGETDYLSRRRRSRDLLEDSTTREITRRSRDPADEYSSSRRRRSIDEEASTGRRRSRDMGSKDSEESSYRRRSREILDSQDAEEVPSYRKSRETTESEEPSFRRRSRELLDNDEEPSYRRSRDVTSTNDEEPSYRRRSREILDSDDKKNSEETNSRQGRSKDLTDTKDKEESLSVEEEAPRRGRKFPDREDRTELKREAKSEPEPELDPEPEPEPEPEVEPEAEPEPEPEPPVLEEDEDHGRVNGVVDHPTENGVDEQQEGDEEEDEEGVVRKEKPQWASMQLKKTKKSVSEEMNEEETSQPKTAPAWSTNQLKSVRKTIIDTEQPPADPAKPAWAQVKLREVKENRPDPITEINQEREKKSTGFEAERVAEEIRKRREEEEAERMLDFRRQREKEEQELQELKERRDKRRKEREERDAKMAEERAKKAALEEEERKKRQEEGERRRRDEAERRKQRGNESETPAWINMKLKTVEGGIDKKDPRQKELREAEKRRVLAERRIKLELDELSAGELREKAAELHGHLSDVVSAKFDLDSKVQRQEYDINELSQRLREMMGKGNKQAMHVEGVDRKFEQWNKMGDSKVQKLAGKKEIVVTGVSDRRKMWEHFNERKDEDEEPPQLLSPKKSDISSGELASRKTMFEQAAAT